MIREWLLAPADTLFFRNGLPFGYGHSVYIESIFPPTPESMQGVIRSSVLHAKCEWDALLECSPCIHKPCSIQDSIGDSPSDLGKLEVFGPYLVKGDKKFFPTPSDIMVEKENLKRIFVLRPPGSPVECDLGSIRFPEKPKADPVLGHFKPVGNWISQDGLHEYLEGKAPNYSCFLSSKEIYTSDCKVGIKREQESHTAEEGNLYSISMVRLKENIKIGVLVNGLPGNLEPSTPYLTKFGGEGKVCMVEIGNGGIPLAAKDKEISVKKNDLIKLVFLSPAYFGRKWHLHRFVNSGSNGADCWEGDIDGAEMRLVSACIDKSYKFGGWDVKAGKSKPIRSFIPAGSVYYLEAMEDKVIPSEGKFGDMTKTGFGHYTIGRWTDV